MRTKTVLLSALLGALGSVSVHAQNVYSLNAVGYINETIYGGYNIISCPLLCTDPSGAQDNQVSNILNNSSGQFNGSTLYFFSGGANSGSTQGRTGSWANNGGTNVLAPGVAVWLHATSNMTVTFVGSVATGPVTNVLNPGYNLVSSIVPTSGDYYSNSISSLSNITANISDALSVYDPTQQEFTFEYTVESLGAARNGNSPWATSHHGDPVVPNVGEGFFYFNNTSTSTPIDWVENYSVNQ